MTQQPNWEEGVLENFKKVIERMPVFVRDMARGQITKKANVTATEQKRDSINEKDLIDAFFSETPSAFHGMMMDDLDAIGLDYKKYGYPEKPNIGWGKPKYDKK